MTPQAACAVPSGRASWPGIGNASSSIRHDEEPSLAHSSTMVLARDGSSTPQPGCGDARPPGRCRARAVSACSVTGLLIRPSNSMLQPLMVVRRLGGLAKATSRVRPSCASCRRSRARLRPSPLGISRSIRIRCGRCMTAARNPAWASWAVRTHAPSRSSICCVLARTERSSSTTRTKIPRKGFEPRGAACGGGLASGIVLSGSSRCGVRNYRMVAGRASGKSHAARVRSLCGAFDYVAACQHTARGGKSPWATRRKSRPLGRWWTWGGRSGVTRPVRDRRFPTPQRARRDVWLPDRHEGTPPVASGHG